MEECCYGLVCCRDSWAAWYGQVALSSGSAVKKSGGKELQGVYHFPSLTQKSSRDYISASLNSYAASISSLAFTLSSSSSVLFDRRPNHDRAKNSIFAHQLKMLYREITNLETKVRQEDSMNDTDDVMSSRVMLKGKEVETEKEKWKKQMSDHKTLFFFCYILSLI